jgi:hypothetical protein
VNPGCEMLVHYFSFLCGASMDSTKSELGHIRLNLCFASGRICGSRGALRCVWGVKHRCTLFLASVGAIWIAQQLVGTPYAEHVCWHPMVSIGHVVHFVPPGHETSTHYFSCSVGTGAVSMKSTSGQVTLNFCFCIQWVMRVK